MGSVASIIRKSAVFVNFWEWRGKGGEKREHGEHGGFTEGTEKRRENIANTGGKEVWRVKRWYGE
jgi:hypothetical protein